MASAPILRRKANGTNDDLLTVSTLPTTSSSSNWRAPFIDPKIWARGKGGFPTGTISFAGFDADDGGSRTCQVFITFSDNRYLGKNPWETPFGRVISGMESVNSIFKGYGGNKGCVGLEYFG